MDNLDSPEKSLSSWPQTLHLSAHAYNISLKPWGCFSPSLFLPSSFPSSPVFHWDLEPTCLEKKAGFVGWFWEWVPRSTSLLSSGKPAANWTGAGFHFLGPVWGCGLPLPSPAVKPEMLVSIFVWKNTSKPQVKQCSGLYIVQIDWFPV